MAREGAAVPGRAGAISSPCVQICDLDPVSSNCRGCGRSLAEIAAWSGLSEAERLAIMARLSSASRP